MGRWKAEGDLRDCHLHVHALARGFEPRRGHALSGGERARTQAVRRRPKRLRSAGVLLTLLAASAAVQAQTPPRVRILNPEHDAVVTSPNVTVVLSSQGVLILPALDSIPGSAHYHLLLDVD